MSKYNHGHKWLTVRDNYPNDYHKYGDEIDVFAYDYCNCNGPECKLCGYSFCKHCKDESDIPNCKASENNCPNCTKPLKFDHHKEFMRCTNCNWSEPL